MSTTIKKLKEYVIDNKKRLIIAAAMLAGLLLITIITGSIYDDSYAEFNSVSTAINGLDNTYEQYKIDLAAKQNAGLQPGNGYDDQNVAYEIKYTPTEAMVDTAKWNTDNEMFWKFISPAFNYNSLDEYIQHRNEYVNMLGENNFFVVNFMSYQVNAEARAKINCGTAFIYFDQTTMEPVKNDNGEIIWDGNVGQGNNTSFITANPNIKALSVYKYDYLMTDKEKKDAIEAANKGFNCEVKKDAFTSYPIGMYEDHYDYIAYVKMSSSYKNVYGKYVIFTYSIDMNDNMTNFKCYPPATAATSY